MLRLLTIFSFTLLILATGVNVHCQSRDLDGELMEASSNGEMNWVKRLLDKGANIETTNDAGATPLMWAAVGGYSDLVRFLLERGADVNAKTKNGATALKGAASAGHLPVVKILVEQGADIGLKDKEGVTALRAAEIAGQVEVAKFLKAGTLQSGNRLSSYSDMRAIQTAYVAKGENQKGLAVHADPSSKSRVIAFLPVGSIIRHEGLGENGWLLINAPVVDGWILESHLKTGKPQAVVTRPDSGVGCLRIRSGPGAKHEQVGCARAAESLTLTGATQDDWVEIEEPIKGWVNSRQVSSDVIASGRAQKVSAVPSKSKRKAKSEDEDSIELDDFDDMDNDSQVAADNDAEDSMTTQGGFSIGARPFSLRMYRGPATNRQAPGFHRR